MEIRRLERNMLENVYSLMKNDFLSDELKPLELIKKYIKNGICSIYGFYEDNKLVSYMDVIFSSTSALIDYFAVVEQYRCTGVGGSSIFSLKHELKDLDFILAEVEAEQQAKTDGDLKTIKRRIAFYEKNGFYLTGNRISLFGHKYNIMALPIKTKPNKETALERLFEIYRLMFSKEIINKHVSIM